MRLNSFTYKLIAAFAAFYFLVAGIGHNVVDYCCNTCETVGIEFLAHHSCADAHHTHSFAESDTHTNCCTATFPSDNGISECPVDGKCELMRFQLGSFHSLTSAVQLQIPVTELDNSEIPEVNLSLVYLQSEKIVYYPPPESTLNSGRAILCHKSVLVI